MRANSRDYSPLQVKRPLEPIFENDIGLRLLEEQDIEMIRTWRNRDDTRIFFEDSKIITTEGQKSWFRQYRQKADDYYFVICWNDGTGYRPAGGVSLYSIADGRAEYGRCLIGDERARRRDLLTKASRILIGIARSRLGLSELYLKVFRTNAAAIRVYEKIGFREVRKDDAYLFMQIKI